MVCAGRGRKVGWGMCGSICRICRGMRVLWGVCGGGCVGVGMCMWGMGRVGCVRVGYVCGGVECGVYMGVWCVRGNV